MRRLGDSMILIFLVLLLFFAPQSAEACRGGLLLFARDVLPTLLPVLIVSSMLEKRGVLHRFSAHLGGVFPMLFHLPAAAAEPFLLSLFCGNPTAARHTAQLQTAGRLTKEEALHTALLSSLVSPALLFSLTPHFLGERFLLPLAVSQYAAILLFALLPKHAPVGSVQTSGIPRVSFLSAFCQSTAEAGGAAIGIGVLIALFSVIRGLCTQIGIPVLLARLHPILPILFDGILEVTGGLKVLGSFSCADPIKAAVGAFFLSFSGLCMLLQSGSFLTKNDFPFGKFLLLRSCQALLAAGIAAIIG